jgi:hypothetical protein
MKIKSYEGFVANKRLVESRRQVIINVLEQFEEIKPIMNEALLIVEFGIFDEGFDNLNEENLISKMKAKFDAAVEIAKEKGKQALTTSQEVIIKLGGKIASIIKLIVEKLKEWVDAAWTAAKSAYASGAQSKIKEITAAIEKKSEESKNLLLKEVKQGKQVVSATVGWITSGFVKDTAKAAQEAASEDVKEAFEIAILDSINEAVINGDIDFTDLVKESDDHGHGPSIPFVSAIAHKMHHIPPFNLLDKVKQAAEKVAKGTLGKLSYYATELAGAPGPFEFLALAGIIGIIAEVQVKGIAKHALLNAIPGLGTIASIISNVAMLLAVIGIIEAIMSKDSEEGEKAH